MREAGTVGEMRDLEGEISHVERDRETNRMGRNDVRKT